MLYTIGMWVGAAGFLLGGFDMSTSPHPYWAWALKALFALVFAYCAPHVYRASRERRRVMREQQAALLAAQRAELEDIASGKLPSVKTDKAILRQGEVAHFAAPGELMELKTTGYSGSTGSVRVRVAKGVTVGGGGIKGKAIREVVSVAKGELAITSGRVIFAGDMKSFEMPIAKLTSIEPYGDGIVFHIGTKSHKIKLLNRHHPQVAKATLDMLLRA